MTKQKTKSPVQETKKNNSSKNSLKKYQLPIIGLGLIFFYLLVFTVSVTSNIFDLGRFNAIVLIKTFQKNTVTLNGTKVFGSYENLRPLAIVIDNHVDARPVAGLDKASVIYEVVSEGDITRFLALFDFSENVKKIGPVRSARPYFIDWANEWQAIFFHSGGSPAAIRQLKNDDLDFVNEISADGVYFYRDTKNSIPHNLYTSSQLLAQAISAKKFDTTPDYQPFSRKENASSDARGENGQEIKVDYLDSDYEVKYVYNQKSNLYQRYLSGKKHKTEDGFLILTPNVIIQTVKHEVLDREGRLELNTKDQGLATYYIDGHKIDGNWKYKDGRTVYVNKDNEEISFNPGMIWINIVFAN